MEHPPVCRNCEAVLDLSVKNPVHSVEYRHVPCPNCGTICILEGSEANVAYRRLPWPRGARWIREAYRPNSRGEE